MTSLKSATETGHFDIDGIYIEYVKPATTSDEHASEPLIFVHGGMHGSWCWTRFLNYFAQAGRCCYALNWYNHYKSSSLPLTQFLARSIGDVSEEIGKVCDRLDGGAVLIGHSMGGLAIQKYAEQHNVAGLVMLAPVCPAGLGVEKIELPAPPVEMDRLLQIPPFEVAKQMFFQGLSDEEALHFYQQLCPESPQAVIEATESTLALDTSRLQCPMLIFSAELDVLAPPKSVKTLAGHYGAEYHFLPGKGHGLTLEPGWEDTATLIERWLEKL